jgi:hypothetical protein
MIAAATAAAAKQVPVDQEEKAGSAGNVVVKEATYPRCFWLPPLTPGNRSRAHYCRLADTIGSGAYSSVFHATLTAAPARFTKKNPDDDHDDGVRTTTAAPGAPETDDDSCTQRAHRIAIKMYWDSFLIQRELIIYKYLWELRDAGRTSLRVPRLLGGGGVRGDRRERDDERGGGGEGHEAHCLAMELMGESLSGYFQTARSGAAQESAGDVYAIIGWLAAEALGQMRLLHETGIVHRDVKPDNLVLTPKRDGLAIIDYGLSSQYVDNEGTHVPMRTDIALIGTARYASTWAHDGCLQSRRDDLMSLCYSLMFLVDRGRLPWIEPMRAAAANPGCNRRQAQAQAAHECKRRFDPHEWGGRCLREAAAASSHRELFRLCATLAMFYEEVRTLGYADRPDYPRWERAFRPRDFDPRVRLRPPAAPSAPPPS